MPQEVISRKTRSNLETLTTSGLLKGFYLGGGTALALQLSHRLSIDLDFFTKKNIDTKALIQKIKQRGNFAIEQESENTLAGSFNGTKIAFLTYDYPLLFPLKKIEGIQVAEARDIACMKLSAISSRGAKKDFIDIFFILQRVVSLKELLRLFKRKYKSVDYNMMHIVKSLIYFKDAAKEPMPKMLEAVSWKKVKDFLKQEVKDIK